MPTTPPSLRRLILLSALGAALWYGFDSLHVREGIFTVGGRHSVPPWMVATYFGGFLGVGLFFRTLEAKRPMPRVDGRRLAIEVAAFLGVLVAHFLLYKHELAYTAVTVGYVVARLVRWRRPGDVAALLFIAGLDLAVELSLISAGLFAYSYARWLAVPLWLFPMWAGLGLGVRRFFAFATTVGT